MQEIMVDMGVTFNVLLSVSFIAIVILSGYIMEKLKYE